MPSPAIPTSIGSSGKAPTKSVSITALRSVPDNALESPAAFVSHSGTGLVTQALTSPTGGGAGAGAGSLENKIANLDSSVRRRRVLSGTLVSGTDSVEGDYVGSAGLEALMATSADPVTGSNLTDGGLLHMRRGTYTLSASPAWTRKVGLIGELENDLYGPLININQAADFFASGTSGGFSRIENLRLGSLDTGRWSFGRSASGLSTLRIAENVWFQAGVYFNRPLDMKVDNCLFEFAGGSTVTSNYNVEIGGGNLLGDSVFRNCQFRDISGSAVDPTVGAVVYIHDQDLSGLTMGSGHLLFDDCTFYVSSDAALVEFNNCYANITFRGCHFECEDRSATARPLFVGLDGNGVKFENCTAKVNGPVFSMLDFGGVIDGFQVERSGDNSVPNATHYHFRGNRYAYADYQSRWMDLRNMDIQVYDVVGSTAAFFVVEDYVRGGDIRILQRNTAWGSGGLFRIIRTLGQYHQLAEFGSITLDLGGEGSGAADPVVFIQGGPLNNFQNTPQVHIGSLVLMNQNYSNRTLVHIINATKIDYLSMEYGGDFTPASNDNPLLSITGPKVDIGYLSIDCTGTSLTVENGPVINITGSRCTIRGGHYLRETSGSSSDVGVFHVTNDYCEIYNFYVLLSYTAITFTEAVVYVRGDHFTMSHCHLLGDSFGGATTFLDLDGEGASIDHNTFKSSVGPDYANIAGDAHVISGNRFLSTSASFPVVNVTATNTVPATLADINVFAANVTTADPIT